ncbi:MAG: hypothetical protein VX899_07240 [Myxococcota bacterium]|nr:hypothetical protein [Myxococcota bacterium]
MTKRLVVDTSVVLHLLLPEPREGQEEGWSEARELLKISDEDWVLAIATPAAGEVLAGVPARSREDVAEFIEQNFEILDLNWDAAKEVGKIATKGLRGRRGEKQRVKVDIEIVGCAVAWGAAGLCALDGDHDRIVERNGLDLLVGPPSAFSPKQEELTFSSDE